MADGNSADPSELYVQYIARLKTRVAARGAANPAAYLAVKLGSLKGGGVSDLDSAPLPSQVRAEPTVKAPTAADSKHFSRSPRGSS